MIQIYKASAGSGKTYTLTREYIKLILGVKTDDGTYKLNPSGADHRSVLAITFTNKATEEMKSRIIHELAMLAGMERGCTDKAKSPYEDWLCAEFGCSPAHLRAAAAAALKGLLFNFNTFSVSTIDAFFQTILRSFAHEAEVSTTYEVQIDDKVVTEKAVDEMLQDLNHKGNSKRNKFLIRWLTNFMTNKIEAGESFNIFNRQLEVHSKFIKFINDITNDTFRAKEDVILGYLSDSSRFESFRRQLHGQAEAIKDDVKALCTTALLAIDRAGMAAKGIHKNIIGPLQKWQNSGYESSPLSATVRKGIDDVDTVYLKDFKSSPSRTPELDAAVWEALDGMRSCQERVTTINILTRNFYHLGLFSTVLSYIDKYRRENSAILLSDTNELLAKIIGDDDSPFLYEKVGTKYSHYLIDEFQDTSFSQWQNIIPLLTESLAVDADNLIIGDEKQSIYRFRGSDPSLLHNLHLEPFALGKTKISGDTINENTNWRSSADVIQFNNTLFTAIAQCAGASDIYSNVAQQVPPKHADLRGYVKMAMHTKTDRSFDAVNEAALALLAAELRRQLESGYRPCDVAVLVYKWSQGHKVVEYLEQLQLADPTYPKFNIVSDSSLLISQSAVVMRIVNRMKVMVANDYASRTKKRTNRQVAELFHHYERAISHGTAPSTALVEAIRASATPICDTVDTVTPEVVPDMLGMDLVSLVEAIIATESISDAQLADENVFITAFRDLVHEFMQRGQGDIRAFLRWWDEHGTTSAVAGGKDPNAINILTIHRSKGLEYPCVHIPFASFDILPKSDELAWFAVPPIAGVDPEVIPPLMPLQVSSSMAGTPFSEQYQEILAQNKLNQLNLEYVAFTRAVNELIVSFCVDQNQPDPSKEADMGAIIRRALALCTPEGIERFTSDIDARGAAVPTFVSFALDSEDVITVGSPTHAPQAEEKKQANAMTPACSVQMPLKQSSKQHDVWKTTRLDSQKLNSIHIARERGIILHGIMANIFTRDDIDTAFNLFRRSPDAKFITQAELEKIKALVTARVNNPAVGEWFDGCTRIMTERDIHTASGETKRFDRVVWTAAGHVCLIDYKTGSQPSERYLMQLLTYIRHLKASGIPNVRGYLYYLDTAEIVEITAT